MRLPWRAAWEACLDLLLSRQPHIRIRTSMGLLALSLMVASSLVMWMVARAGGASVSAVNIWALVSDGGLLAMTLSIRFGCTQELADPSLTIPQMLLTIASGAVAYVLAGEARGIVPAVLALILFFGTFSLNIRQSVAMGLYALAAFALAAWYPGGEANARGERLDLAYGFMVGIVLVGTTAISLRIQIIRMRLRQQNQRLKAALEEIRELAIRDALTGLLNRRHMQEVLWLEARRGERRPETMIIAALDIDSFKTVNDLHGHAMGDQVLQACAHVIGGALRQGDVLSRWGGDEFILLITDIDGGAAAELLERIRSAVEAMKIEGPGVELRITVSIGAVMHRPGRSVEDTLELADQALYAAKRAGRNAVVMGEVGTSVMP